MKRIEIAALLSDSKKIVERLQRRGVVEICDNTDEELVRLNTQAMIGVFEKNLNLAEQAKEIMARYVPVKTGLFDSLRGRRELTTEAFGKQVEQAERMLKKCYDIVSLEKQIHDASEEMIRLRTQMDALEPGRKLDVSMAAASTRRTRCFAGSLPGLPPPAVRQRSRLRSVPRTPQPGRRPAQGCAGRHREAARRCAEQGGV